MAQNFGGLESLGIAEGKAMFLFFFQKHMCFCLFSVFVCYYIEDLILKKQKDRCFPKLGDIICLCIFQGRVHLGT